MPNRLPAAALLAVLAGCAAFSATAQQPSGPISNPSAADLRSLLAPAAPAASAEPAMATRGFKRTTPPSTDGLCTGEGARAVAAPGGTRNLEVVPYGGSDAPHADLAVQFANNSDEITAAGQKLLDVVVSVLKEPGFANARFAVAGHTDATGPDRINLELSCARAISVRQYLVRRGIPAERLAAYGFGSSKPLEAGVVASDRNRRVEIRRAE